MQVVSNPQEIYARLAYEKGAGRSVGLVPTMGALHAGHVSLVDQARQLCDVVATTIFVNPTQFGPNEDFHKYPRTVDEDLQKLKSAGADFVFLPEASLIYPTGFSTYVEPPEVARRWEGEIRPGHFRGVATIVLKLFQLLPSTIAFFGRKDFQQVAVIKKMVSDLNVPIRIEACATVREHDGLAMSSRNRYLADQDRWRALGLWHALQAATDQAATGEQRCSVLNETMHRILSEHEVSKIDYATIVDSETLEPLELLQGGAVALIAARIGATRLIDNLTLVE